ncbi:hypothetical protein C8R47DRAFT_1062630 [Mycena vitilis]|nr:hypothetical protein C8R47DRAFT_1062630 [Mycena vitilis]
MFSASQNLTVTAGTMTNITKICHSAPPVLPDFQTIPRGDIDLQHEIHVDKFSEVVYWGEQRPRCSVRRVNSATIQGQKFTVAVYRGDGAEEVHNATDWKDDLSRYSHLCHPNFVQLWGVVSSSRIHAAIFHDDLVTFEHFRDSHRDRPILIVYIYAYLAVEYWLTLEQKSREYFNSEFEGSGLYHHMCSLWIRLSTGRLCLDPAAEGTSGRFRINDGIDMESNPPALTSLKAPGTESMAVNSLSLDQYHRTCGSSLGRHRWISVPASETIHPASLIHWPSPFQESVRLASIPDLEISLVKWRSSDMVGNVGNVMQNGWTRYHFAGGLSGLPVFFGTAQDYDRIYEFWLSQANHLLGRVQITTHLEDYRKFHVVTHLEYGISLSLANNATGDPRVGYFFLCPTADFITGPFSSRWPACPAYWSLDPSGIERLSTGEANRLGFPSIQLKTGMFLCSWDASVYAGLCQFHQAKGFDPHSQDVARHLGHPLYQLTSDLEDPFAHLTVERQDFWSDDKDWNLGFADREREDWRSSAHKRNARDKEIYAEEDFRREENQRMSSAKDHCAQYRLDTQEEPQLVSSTFNLLIVVHLALILLAWLCAAVSNGGRHIFSVVGFGLVLTNIYSAWMKKAVDIRDTFQPMLPL